jgi:hypothetical protein
MNPLEQLPAEMLEELADTKILVLVTGTLMDGSEHYAYASIPLANYLEFKQAEAKGNYRLDDFGVVICHGDGLVPAPDVAQKMADEYGASHLFESQMNEMLDQFQAGNH